jgi:hypothetical protein
VPSHDPSLDRGNSSQRRSVTLEQPGRSNPGLHLSPLRAASRREAFCGPALLCPDVRTLRFDSSLRSSLNDRVRRLPRSLRSSLNDRRCATGSRSLSERSESKRPRPTPRDAARPVRSARRAATARRTP